MLHTVWGGFGFRASVLKSLELWDLMLKGSRVQRVRVVNLRVLGHASSKISDPRTLGFRVIGL